jgi:hypothetical protein
MVGLDIEATQATIAGHADRALVELRALRGEAERQLTAAAAAVERVERDYFTGELSAPSYEHLLPKARGEHAAALAEAERLGEREQAVLEAVELRDVEEETLQRLASIRAAIAGEIDDGSGIDAVRAALISLFESFTLWRCDQPGAPRVRKDELAWEAGGASYFIDPQVRESVIEEMFPRLPDGEYQTEKFDLFLRQIPLNLAENKDARGLSIESLFLALFGPIRVTG